MTPEKPPKNRRIINRVKTNKTIARLTYIPQKHKQKFVKKLRQKLANKPPQNPSTSPPPPTSLKIGSINIDGLDLEASWAVEQLLAEHGFDVSLNLHLQNNNVINKLIKVLAISETFGRSDKHSTLPPTPGYSTWKTERGGSDKGGGGLCILYKPSLTPHPWTPPVSPKHQYVTNERQWLLLDNGIEKCALLHVYIACQSNKSDGFLQWNEDLFFILTQEALKLRQQGFMILSLGDFNSRVGRIPGLENNTPDLNRNTPMFLNFISQVNLIIINTLPIAKGLFTRFMDNSGRPGTKSLIDYGLINTEHAHTVTSFVIDEEARYDCGADHALLIVILEFGSNSKTKWSFHEALRLHFDEDSDFSGYQTQLDLLSNNIPLHHFETLPSEQMLPHLTNCIKESGKKNFKLKVKKTKRGIKLPKQILDKIKYKNELARSTSHAHQQNLPSANHLQDKLDAAKADIKSTLSDLNLKRRHRLRSKTLLADPSRKKFWRFLKNHIQHAGNITGAYNKAGNMVFRQEEIEDAVLDHFQKIFLGQRIPVYPSSEHSDQVSLSILDLEKLLGKNQLEHPEDMFEEQVCSPYTHLELTQILANLPSGKSSGYDQVPNELLKHSSFSFIQYILCFLNRIIKDGKVPQELNLGKCMLIHKVN